MKYAGKSMGALAAAMLSMTIWGGDAAAETELVVSSYLPETLFNSMTVKHFGDLVTERTNGEVTFKYYFNASLANEKESLPLMTSGAIDIGFVAAAYYPAEFPLTTLFDVPMLSNHMDATQKAANILYSENEAFQEEFDRLGLKLLMVTVADISPLGSDKRIETMADLEGMRIRSTGMLAKLVEAWGATPVPLGSTEIYQSMQSGLLDGFTAQPLQDYLAKSLDTVTEYAIDVGLGIYHTGYFAINQETFDSLSPEVQQIIEDAAKEANARSNEINMTNTRAAVPAVMENGLELYSLDDEAKAEMREVGLAAVTGAWLSQAINSGTDEKTAQALLDRFVELTTQFDAEAEALNYWEIYQQDFAN